jgi:lipid A 3-O-deacylase
MRLVILAGILATGCLTASAWGVEVPPVEPVRVALVGGAAGILDKNQRGFWGMEYRPAFRYHGIGPWFFFGNRNRDLYYAAAGLMFDFPLGRRWRLTPSFGAGYYHVDHVRGDLNLGHNVEFRSGLELSRQFASGHRLGLGVFHLSNAALGHHNPGTELLQLSWAIPIGESRLAP